SHLRKHGNPLYVLPWYLVIGESGSGKSTAIGSARLSSTFAEVNRTSGISGTRNCDWWFFEQAIILDTAGRWTIPIDEDKDTEEWNRFLNLLSKYRKKEPLNGICVTIAANKLLDASPEVLEEDGKNIRSRIDELMRALGFKFPVYVLVTKCDLMQGMNEFCDYLPEKGLDQPMGLVNHDLSTDIVDFQKRTFESIDERLRSIRLLLLHQQEPGGARPGILLFPEEFRNLQKGLEAFLKGAFKKNPYQEASTLRGLYFSSGKQEGTPFSHFLNSLGLIGEQEVL
ncbi:MAG: type VI secretion system protein ImpL, partial [Proteobacteria bacterium]|nr:type VI secretion system protein ImpL [Pseudomonadota bacterium]